MDKWLSDGDLKKCSIPVVPEGCHTELDLIIAVVILSNALLTTLNEGRLVTCVF